MSTIDEIFNREIVRELLSQVVVDVDDILVDTIWNHCNGNPWNATIMYEILKSSNKL